MEAVVHATASPASTCTGMPVTSHGGFQGDSPIHFALPLLIIQTCIVLVVTRTLAICMKPLRQPRVVAEIIGGILLGPSAMGRVEGYLTHIFPSRSLTVLETVANLGLIFFLFMVGLELDLRAVMRTGRQTLIIAAAGICAPFATGVGVSVVLRNTICNEGKFSAFLIFMGVAMSITAFPVLARILAERRLLTTDVGQMAMSAAAVNDVVAWILLALAVALSGSDTSPTVAVWVMLTGLAYLVVMFTVVKRFMAFVGVLASAFATDVLGIHSIFGAFVFGLIIPKDGPLAKLVIEKIEDFVMVLMLPLYFVSSGLKTNIGSIHGARSTGLTVLVICAACAGKIIGTFVPTVLYGVPPRKALTLGFLMNTKGLVELIVLNIGRERGVLNDETFAIMVIMALVTTFITTPVVMALYKPARNPVPYLLRTLDMSKPDDELRVLACVHGIQNVPGMINLVDLARGTSRYPMRLYVLHLTELSERSSAIVMVHQARKNGRPFHDRKHGGEGKSHIYVAFEAFGHLSEVKVRPMTSISDFSDMHDDICVTASDKRASLLLLPFHRLHRPDGSLETLNAGFQRVNELVLKNSPCSVGIFIDRRLLEEYHGPMQLVSTSAASSSASVAVLFFGGADDREALALGLRMAQHPGVNVKILHFACAPEAMAETTRRTSTVAAASRKSFRKSKSPSRRSFRKSIFKAEGDHHIYHVDLEAIDFAKEKALDADALAKVPLHHDHDASEAGTGQSTKYERIFVTDPIEAVLEAVRGSDYSLVLVGRGSKPSQLIASMQDLSLEYEELGPVGSRLAMADAKIKASILVLQHYAGNEKKGISAAAAAAAAAADAADAYSPA